MNPFRLTGPSVLYAAGHFLVDLCCALIIRSLSADPWHFVLYNFLAFAVQMPIGLLADIFGHNRRFALAGICLVLFGFLPLGILLQVSCVGLGNACYHVGGGRDALLKKDGLTGLGIFVSPGAIGIMLGTLFSGNFIVHTVAAVSLAVCGILICMYCPAGTQTIPKKQLRLPPAVLMLTVVLLRSLVGTCMETPWKIGVFVVLSAAAAAAGKALGGFVADPFGWKRTGVVSLLAAAVLFLLPDMAVAGVIGVLLFNMTMPITLGQAAQCCRGFEGFSFGLLTFGLFLGYLPSAFGISISPIIGTGMSLISAGLLMLSPEVSYD